MQNQFETKRVWFNLQRFVVIILPLLLVSSLTPQIAISAPPDWRPEKTISIIVHTGPGGGNDKQARMIQKIIKEKKIITTNIVVVNKPGASGALAWGYLNRQAGNAHYISTAVQQLLTIDISKGTLNYLDYTPIAILNTGYVGFMVKPDSPIKTGQDLIDRLKKDPKSVSIGSGGGLGGANHNTTCLVMNKAGDIDFTKLKIVIFGSTGESVAALLGGHVDLVTTTTPNIPGLLEAGKVRVIAISAPQRLKGIFSDVPTWREQGIDVVFSNWRGIIAPKGIDKAQLAFWDKVIAKVAKTKEWEKYNKRTYQESIYVGSKGAKDFLAREYETLKKLLTRLGLTK